MNLKTELKEFSNRQFGQRVDVKCVNKAGGIRTGIRNLHNTFKKCDKWRS
jgi:hypothetical protein